MREKINYGITIVGILALTACRDVPSRNAALPVPSSPEDGASNVDAEPDDVVAEKIPRSDGRPASPFAYSAPSIVREGSTLHAYFAGQTISGRYYNIPHATFAAGVWTFVGEALPHLGKDAVDNTGKQPVWAPAAAQIDSDHWMLYYTAKVAGTKTKKCIWRAHAKDANGPFVDDYPGPIECASDTRWSLDPYLVKDERGTWYLGARIDAGAGVNTIAIRALGPLAQAYAPSTSWITLTQNSATSWEKPVLENAGIVRLAPPNGPAHWFVFYSGRAWSDDSYSIGYADCGESIEGPCTKKTPNGPWLQTDARVGMFGPGTPTFYADEKGATLMSVQAWEFTGGKSNKQNDGQIMRTFTVTVDDHYVPKAVLLRVDL